MDQSHHIILTPFNYFEWKGRTEIVMRSKGIYKVTMQTKSNPNTITKNVKQHNKRHESYVLLYLTISRDLLFHLDGLSAPDEVWEKLQTLFGNTNEMSDHKLENELISLSPSSFKSLQFYLSKFKALVLQLK